MYTRNGFSVRSVRVEPSAEKTPFRKFQTLRASRQGAKESVLVSDAHILSTQAMVRLAERYSARVGEECG